MKNKAGFQQEIKMKYSKEQIKNALNDLKLKLNIYTDLSLVELTEKDREYYLGKIDLVEKRIKELEEMLSK